MAVLSKKVIKILRMYSDLTNQEMGGMIGKDASTVSGIVRPLVKKEIIIESCKRPCNITGRRVIAWRLAKRDQQLL